MRLGGRFTWRPSGIGGSRRTRFEVTIFGPPGPAQRRLLETLRESGYTVTEPERTGNGSQTIKVVVEVPYGETNG